MPSFGEIGRRDERLPHTFHLTSPAGTKFAVAAELFINRITLEPVEIDVADYVQDDEDPDDLTPSDVASLRLAVGFCDVLASWDMTGPMTDRLGREVVPAGAPVPLDPRLVRFAPLWFHNQITSQTLELVNPNPIRSRGSRKR